MALIIPDNTDNPADAQQKQIQNVADADNINARIGAGIQQRQQSAINLFNQGVAANPLITNAQAANALSDDQSVIGQVGDAFGAVGASVLTSFWNTGVALANAFGGDYEETSADQFLNNIGADQAAKYYTNHKMGVDVAGLIAGSLIPGIAGIKVLKLAQAAAATSDIRLVAGLGKLAASTDDIKAGVAAIRSGAQKTIWSADSAKLIAAAGGQGALEGVAATWAMLATMNQSPTLNPDNLGYFDSIQKGFTVETAFGAVAGGVFGAGLGAITYKGMARKALNFVRGEEADLLKNVKAPNSFASTDANGTTTISLSAGDKVGYHADDYQMTAAKINDLQQQNTLGTISEADKNITLPTLEQRLLSVSNEMRTQIKNLSGDVDVQQQLQNLFASTPEGIAQAKSTLTGALNVSPAMKGLGTFRPASLDNELVADALAPIISNPLPAGVNPADILYGDNAFMKMVATQQGQYNDLAAGNGSDFLTTLINADAKTFGNTSGTGPINLRRAMADMTAVSKQVNPDRWKEVTKFQNKYRNVTPADIAAMNPQEKAQFRLGMQNSIDAHSAENVFTDVHGALSTEQLAPVVAKQFPRMVEYLNKNQLTANFLKNNYSTLDTLTGQVFHQNILPTPADFGKPVLRKTALDQNLNFGAYSVPVKPGLFNTDAMPTFASASSGGLGTKETSNLLKQYDEYAVKQNAQYVGAQLDSKFIKGVEKQDGKTIIGQTDLPYLDAALSSKANTFNVEGLGVMDRDALNTYVRNTKLQKIQEAQNANNSHKSSWSVEHLSRIFNTDDTFVELGGATARNDVGQHSLQNLSEGTPRFLKVKYATDFDKTQPDVAARWQAITTANKTAAQNVAINVLSSLDTTLSMNLADVTEAMPSVKSIATEQGTSYLAAANGAFGTYESRMQQIGQMVNTAHHRVAQEIQGTMLPLTQALLKDELARAEIGVVVQKARSGRFIAGDSLADSINQITPYAQQISDPQAFAAFASRLQNLNAQASAIAQKSGNGLFVHADTLQVLSNLRAALTAGPMSSTKLDRIFSAAAAKLDAAKSEMFGIKSPKVAEYLKSHMSINSKYVNLRTQINAASGKVTRWNPDELYFGPPDIDGKSVAFVQSPQTPSGERARHMIIANTPEERNMQMEIIKRDYGGDGYKVFSDPQTADFKEALANWQGGNWKSTPEFVSDLQNKGVANNFFPRSDGKDAVFAVNDTIKRHTQLIRDSVETRYAEDFASLRGMEDNWDTLYGKQARGSNNAYMADNPARKLRQLGLDMPQDSSQAVSQVNSFVNNVADKVGRSLENAFTPGNKFTMDDVNRINGIMQDAGMKTAYANAAELALANSGVPNNLVRQFTATANAFVSLGMHRLETMMPLINAVGNTVLSVPLIGTLIRNLPEDVRNANFGAFNGVATELAIPKFMAQSMGAIMKDHKSLFAKYEAMGLPISHSRVYSQMMDTLVTEGDITAGGIASKITSQMNKMGNFAGRYNGSNVLTGFNRLLNAHMGERLADLAGATNGLAKSSFINTFMNKVEGTMVSTQRPKFFQGVIGQAMGLFQSYNLHLMQQLTSNLLDGNARATIEALAMNGTLFGAQSLPGWDELNSVVMNHNRNGYGVDTYVNDAVGNDVGNWLTYGSLSNILHMGVFTRGRIDLGFGLTGSIADKIPAVSILQNTFAGVANTISNMSRNGVSTNGLLEGINTMGWNRPAAELAQRALGYSPNKNGDIIAYNQQGQSTFSNAWSVFGAALGAKDLDTAIATTQYYESKQRKAAIQDKLNRLGSNVKAATHNGQELSQEQVEMFAQRYSTSGGDLKNFQRWIINSSLRGQQAQVEVMRKGINSASGRQAQALMGGAAPDLFNYDSDYDGDN